MNAETHWLLGWLAAEDAIDHPDEAIRAFGYFKRLSSDPSEIAEANKAINRLRQR